MADKLKISKESSEQLNFLSTRLNLKRNLVCRIALSISLATREPISESIDTDTEGYEFNKSTILGPDETYFKSLSAYVQNKSNTSDFYNIVVRNHIERGLRIMFNDYQTVNSPVGYLSSLLDKENQD